ncbi:MAG: WD40 repeat domain-containing protein [Phycisphaerae bacterium]|nr:WD40 repeat domain-containing protein [Phycisphaerae bacterium]
MDTLESNKHKRCGIGAVQIDGSFGCSRFYSMVAILAVVVLMSSQGCIWQYWPIHLEAPDGRVAYSLTTKAKKDSYHTRLTRRQDSGSMSLFLEGKAESMALSPDGQMLAIALAECSTHITYRVILVQANTLRVLRQLPIALPDVTRDSDGYMPSIQRFDCMALSHDSKKLATYFWKPSQEGYKSVVALWDTKTGGLLQELRLPEHDAILRTQVYTEDVASMAFSENGAFLGMSGAWSIKDDVEQPDGFIRVWRLSDGKDIATLRPKGLRFLWSLCFDKPAHHVAGWHWIGGDDRRSAVTIWALPKGEQTGKKVFDSKVRSITWSHEKNGFAVRTDQSSLTYMLPMSKIPSAMGKRKNPVGKGKKPK